MTDTVEPDFSPVVAAADGQTQTAGGLLRAARAEAGLEIEAVATALKVPVARVRALEANDWDSFPDAVFLRALATSVCRLLKISPAPILVLLPQAERKVLKVDEGINAQFRRPGGPITPRLPSMPFSIPLAWAAGALALAVGAGVLAWWLPAEGGAEIAKAVVPEGQSLGAVVMVTSSVPVASAPASQPASVPVAVVAASGPSSAPSAVAATAPVASMPAVPVASAAAAPPPASAPVAATGQVRVAFQTKGESWLEVVDGKGVTLLRKQAVAGESVAVAGTPPLNVLVGRVDHTVVEVRGKPIDLSAQARSNVARFEVK